MNIKQLITIILVLSSFLVSCEPGVTEIGPGQIVSGSGNVVTEEREASGFTAVTLNGVGQLVIDQTGSETVAITADDNFLPYIETRVSGGRLIISIAENTTFNNVTELTYHVTVAELDRMELNGFGDIRVQHLDQPSWNVTLSGGGNVTVSGRVDEQMVEINGAGAYNAENLTSQEATVRHNGAGMTVVQVSDHLDVRIEGMGMVEYIGDPKVTENINGLGSVSQR